VIKQRQQDRDGLTDPNTELVPCDPIRVIEAAKIVVKVLRQSTKDPGEAYAVLRFLQEGYEERFGIRGIIVAKREKDDHTS
jgi:hypothetical protein